MKFYGQQGEDMIAWELFKDSQPGFFVDVGAYDGVSSSNSLFFEQQGWKGVCFEPGRWAFGKLRENRKCVLMNCIVGERVSNAEYFELDGNRHPGLLRRSTKQTDSTLPIITLNYALSILGIRHVDYVSIDVEGWEWQVLWGFDIQKYDPRLVIIEDNHDKSVDRYFMDNGYILGRTSYFNALYVKNEADAKAIALIATNMENGRLMS